MQSSKQTATAIYQQNHLLLKETCVFNEQSQSRLDRATEKVQARK